MGFPALEDDQLFIGKATIEDWKDAQPLASLAVLDAGGSVVGQNTGFAGNAPLWTYILAEAAWEWSQKAFPGGADEVPDEGGDRIPVRLGDVGSTIVAETFLGLLLGDSFSFLKQDPLWTPRADLRRLNGSGASLPFTVFDLVRPR